MPDQFIRPEECHKIKIPIFGALVYLDLREKSIAVDENNKVVNQNVGGDSAGAFAMEGDPGVVYIWLGGKYVKHSTIAHECLHIVDMLTRSFTKVINPSPANGDLTDETRAYLLGYIYGEIQKIMIKKKKYPPK